MEQLNLIDLTLLLAAAQGIFLGLFLLYKHRKPVPNRLLILLIFSYSIVLLQMTGNELGWFNKAPYLIPVVLGLVFVMIPTHYYYALHLTRPARKMQPRDLLHLIPFAALELFQGIGMLRGGDPTESWFEPNLGGITLFNVILLVYSLTYMFLTLVRLQRHAKQSADFLSNLERIHFNWLRNLTWLTIIILVFFTVENLLLLKNIHLSDDFNLTSFLTAVFVYAVGFICLIHPEILVIPDAETRGSGETMIPRGEEQSTPSSAKYQRSGLTDERAEEIRAALDDAMNAEALYSDPDLTLNDLATHLDVSPHNLSEVINTRLGQNFFDYVNSFRIEQVKRDILDLEKRHLKLLAIAFEAGFRSKSSFNLLFKKHVGMTPSEYRQQQSA